MLTSIRFGSRFLWNTKQRKDANQKRKVTDTRDGKETLTSVQRKRARASTAAIPFGGRSENVFGYRPVAHAELDRLRRREQTEVFDKVARAAQQRFEEKKKRYKSVRRGDVPSLCFMSSAERGKFAKRMAAKRRIWAGRCIFGNTTFTWTEVLRSLGGTGDPMIYIEPGVAPSGFLDRDLGGKPLRDYTVPSIDAFVSSMVAPLRRIMLVRSVENISPEMQLAAAVTRARVQQQLLVPLLHFSQPGPLVLCFTAAFAREEKRTVTVAKRLARHHCQAWHPVQVSPLGRFWASVDAAGATAKRQHCLVYLADTDEELSGISAARASVARTFSEFMSAMMTVRAAAVQ